MGIRQRLSGAAERVASIGGRFRRSERGSVIIMVALGMVVLCGFAALALDGGRMYTTRGELQNSADAAALAGGQSLTADWATAEAAARDWAERNGIAEDEIVSVELDSSCSGGGGGSAALPGLGGSALAANTIGVLEDLLPERPNHHKPGHGDDGGGDDDDGGGDDDDGGGGGGSDTPDGPTISVTVERNVEFAFARVLGITDSDVTACATVQIGSPVGMIGVIPLSVEEDDINFGGTTILKAKHASGPNTGEIRIDGPGANVYRDGLKFGSSTYVCAKNSGGDPSCYVRDAQPGVQVGPTEQGINYRFDNTIAACDDFDEVFQLRDDGKYGFVPGCNPFQGDDGSLRVVVIPVIDELPSNGSKPVTILSFAIFWLEGFADGCSGNSCTIEGTFVDFVGDVGGELGSPTDGIVFSRLVE